MIQQPFLRQSKSRSPQHGPVGYDWRRLVGPIVFVVYFFFVLYGTSLPFQESIQEVDQIGTSNIVNQVAFSFVFLMASVVLVGQLGLVVSVFRRDKLLFIFLAWCFLSLSWSGFPAVSFKRFFQFATTVWVCLAVLLNVDSPEDVVRLMRYLYNIYIPLCLLSVILVAGAMDPETMSWRGLAPSKNHLGQACLISILVYLEWILHGSTKARFVAFGYLMVSVLLLLGSRSTTSLLAILLLAAWQGLVLFNRHFASPRVGSVFMGLVALSLLIFLGITFLGDKVLLNMITEMLGKDPSFTGRTDLWKYIFREVKNHWFMGCGFGGFWLPDHSALQIIYEDFVWLPNQSHNGYLDILNELGVVGLFMFGLMTVRCLASFANKDRVNYLMWFAISALIVNLQESTLIRPNVLTGVLFFLSYVSVSVDFAVEPGLDESVDERFYEPEAEIQNS